MSEEMVRLLVHAIDTRDRTPRHVVFPTELVVRESSGAPAARSEALSAGGQTDR